MGPAATIPGGITKARSGFSRPAGRVAVLVGLLVLAGLSLRGRLPAVRTGSREPSPDSPTTLAGIATLLAVCMVILAIALYASARGPVRAVPGLRREFPRGPDAGRGRLDRRLLLAAIGLLMAWLVFFILLNQLGGPDPAQPPAPSSPGADGSTADAGSSPPAREPKPSRGGGEVFILLVTTTVVMAAMIVAGAVIAARRRRRPPGATPVRPARAREGSPDPGPLAEAAELGLAEVGDRSREPREAIIACYAAMERALAGSPHAAPRESDTPSEVLARAVDTRVLRAASATTLVELFAEARFSTHVMSEEHRLAAEQALRSVLEDARLESAAAR